MELWLWIILAALFFGLIAGDTIDPVGDVEVSEREGETVTLACTYQTSYTGVALHWYRHHSELQAPQFILWKGAKGYTSEYIPDKRYQSKTSEISTELTITVLTLADSALYYCALDFDRWVSALIFGKPIRLTVTPKDPPPEKPTLFVLSPLQPEGVPLDKLADEVCLATNFHPNTTEMVLNVKDQQVNLSTSSAAPYPTTNNYFYAGFSNKTIHSCELQDSFSNNMNVDLCADLHPEKARLNFLLLVMHGVRVVFTKTLAFSTILTIRAVLF